MRIMQLLECFKKLHVCFFSLFWFKIHVPVSFPKCLIVFNCVIKSMDLTGQVYSDTRVPTRVNTNQHESGTSQHKSTRVRNESNTSQHESTLVRHEQRDSNTSQLKQQESKTGLDHEKEKNMAKRKDKT